MLSDITYVNNCIFIFTATEKDFVVIGLQHTQNLESISQRFKTLDGKRCVAACEGKRVVQTTNNTVTWYQCRYNIRLPSYWLQACVDGNEPPPQSRHSLWK